ncbi:hypothetical protein [Sulfuriflexus sp.]|uniref:hypothetical protein n=1 Tax=Sulfuriflexus sp. TaxID=2015443 RepID=UPI0028CDB11C|nr:hypothetical protein [Sulfuriflexus sp.]MDT8403205.1 hypothetical protein [Sulfuriflexus sp.]
MKQIFKLLALASLVVLLATGCRTAPVKNIDNAPIEVSQKHSSGDIKKAIVRAGATLGWKMKSVKDGHIVGTLYLRDHVAVVDINYSKNSYSIKYKSSENLHYDGTTIHSNYNGWITNLNRSIQVQISTI